MVLILIFKFKTILKYAYKYTKFYIKTIFFLFFKYLKSNKNVRIQKKKPYNTNDILLSGYSSRITFTLGLFFFLITERSKLIFMNRKKFIGTLNRENFFYFIFLFISSFFILVDVKLSSFIDVD